MPSSLLTLPPFQRHCHPHRSNGGKTGRRLTVAPDELLRKRWKCKDGRRLQGELAAGGERDKQRLESAVAFEFHLRAFPNRSVHRRYH